MLIFLCNLLDILLVEIKDIVEACKAFVVVMEENVVDQPMISMEMTIRRTAL